METKRNKKNSDARIRANTRYIDKSRAAGKIKQLNLTLQGTDYALIDDYCKARGISKAAFIVGAARYIIDNNIHLTAAESEYIGTAAEDIGKKD